MRVDGCVSGSARSTGLAASHPAAQTARAAHTRVVKVSLMTGDVGFGTWRQACETRWGALEIGLLPRESEILLGQETNYKGDRANVAGHGRCVEPCRYLGASTFKFAGLTLRYFACIVRRYELVCVTSPPSRLWLWKSQGCRERGPRSWHRIMNRSFD